MSKIKRNNLEFTYRDKGTQRGGYWYYKVITRKNRDRKGGHTHRRWFETDIMKRYYRIQTRKGAHISINEGLDEWWNQKIYDQMIDDYWGYQRDQDEEPEFWDNEEDYDPWSDYPDTWDYEEDKYAESLEREMMHADDYEW